MIQSYTVTEDIPVLRLAKDQVVLIEDGRVTGFQVLPDVYAGIMPILEAQGVVTRISDEASSPSPAVRSATVGVRSGRGSRLRLEA